MSNLDKLKRLAELRRLRDLERCKNDLWFLATEYLGYRWNPDAGGDGFKGKGLTERLHKPICQWLDARRYKSALFVSMSRFYHKTTINVAQVIQDYLRDPNISILYAHAKESEALDVKSEIERQFLLNKKLRSLDPVGRYPPEYQFASELSGKAYKIFPAPNATKWISAATGEFTINRDQKIKRSASFRATGVRNEIVGFHCNKAYLDDIIGPSTMTESGSVHKIGHWMESTVLPVVDDGVFRATGTPWAEEGLYQDWWNSPDWDSMKIPGATVEVLEEVDWTQDKIHLTPDYDLVNVNYGPLEYQATARKRLQFLKRQMKANFGRQIMLDDAPDSEKPWNKETCENYVARDDLWKSRGTIFVLSDPAPARVGSQDGIGEKSRGDGTKDAWSLAVIRIQVNGNRLERVLLDGTASREWTRHKGCDEAARLMKKWNTPFVAHEAYGGLSHDYEEDQKHACRRAGVAFHYVKFKDMRQGKNERFAALAGEAEMDLFMISAETCDEEFLGIFLEQARAWRPIAGTKNNTNKFDDHADVVSRSCDSGLNKFSPQPMAGMQGEMSADIGSPFQRVEAPSSPRSQWIAI